MLKNWLEGKLRNHTGTWSWLVLNLRSKNLNLVLKLMGHTQEALSRGLAQPDVVFGNVTQAVGVRDEMKGSPRHKAHPSGLGWPARRQHRGGRTSQWKSEDKHGFGKGSRPQRAESEELEQFPSKQLWLQAFGVRSFNGMHFSLPLLVLYQHLSQLQQYPNNPGASSANGRRSATSHSWTAHFSTGFSAIKRPRCSGMILFVRKMGVLERVPWTQTLGWIFAHGGII